MSTTQAAERQEQTVDQEPIFDKAHPVDISGLFGGWLVPRFTEELLDETEAAYGLDDLRLAEVHNRTGEEGVEMLLVAPDATRVFIGEDTTARDSNGLFGYVIRPDDRLPLVRTTQEALDLLKPAQAAAAEMEDATPLRQGEWFLVPTDEDPVSEAFSGEVGQRPFGGSPLENHVPTEYALGVTAPDFLDGFGEMCPDLAEKWETPGEVFNRVAQGHRVAELEGVEMETDLPTVDELRELAEPVYVRGTLRHRENDHYMESIGDQWHLAVTHDVDVFTVETSALTTSSTVVRLD